MKTDAKEITVKMADGAEHTYTGASIKLDDGWIAVTEGSASPGAPEAPVVFSSAHVAYVRINRQPPAAPRARSV